MDERNDDEDMGDIEVIDDKMNRSFQNPSHLEKTTEYLIFRYSRVNLVISNLIRNMKSVPTKEKLVCPPLERKQSSRARSENCRGPNNIGHFFL